MNERYNGYIQLCKDNISIPIENFSVRLSIEKNTFLSLIDVVVSKSIYEKYFKISSSTSLEIKEKITLGLSLSNDDNNKNCVCKIISYIVDETKYRVYLIEKDQQEIQLKHVYVQ